MEAVVVAYMQLYLPTKIIFGILDHWHYNGIKSPFWLLFNGVAFITQFAALATLCRLFQQKCSENIRVGADANFFILTHTKPPPLPPPPPPEIAAPDDEGTWWRGWSNASVTVPQFDPY